jgi:hypothetical protein
VTPAHWSGLPAAKIGIAVVVAAGLVVFGLALPWSPRSPALALVTTTDRSSAATFNWTSGPHGGPDYVFPPVSVVSDFAAVGSAVSSSLNLTATGYVDPYSPDGGVGGFEVNITGALVPSLRPDSLRFVMVEWANSTIRSGIILFPVGGSNRNLSNLDAAWSGQQDTQTGGPGSVSFQIGLENETNGSLPVGSASYGFFWSLAAQVEFIPLTSGETTFSFFAILQGLSPTVYCAVTIQLAEFLR